MIGATVGDLGRAVRVRRLPLGGCWGGDSNGLDSASGAHVRRRARGRARAVTKRFPPIRPSADHAAGFLGMLIAHPGFLAWLPNARATSSAAPSWMNVRPCSASARSRSTLGAERRRRRLMQDALDRAAARNAPGVRSTPVWAYHNRHSESRLSVNAGPAAGTCPSPDIRFGRRNSPISPPAMRSAVRFMGLIAAAGLRDAIGAERRRSWSSISARFSGYTTLVGWSRVTRSREPTAT